MSTRRIILCGAMAVIAILLAAIVNGGSSEAELSAEDANNAGASVSDEVQRDLTATLGLDDPGIAPETVTTLPEAAPPTTAAPEATPALNPATTTTRLLAPPPAKRGPGSTNVNDSAIGTGLNQISYAGSWAVTQRAGKFQNDDHQSQTGGDSFSMAFEGNAIALFGSRDIQHGQASVQIDNNPSVTVDYFATSRAENVSIFNKTGLDNGRHTIKVTVLGKSSNGPSRNVVTVDRFVVTN